MQKSTGLTAQTPEDHRPELVLCFPTGASGGPVVLGFGRRGPIDLLLCLPLLASPRASDLSSLSQNFPGPSPHPSMSSPADKIQTLFSLFRDSLGKNNFSLKFKCLFQRLLPSFHASAKQPVSCLFIIEDHQLQGS